MESAIKYFLLILGSALLSSLLGGVFAAAVAFITPEFVDDLFSIKEDASAIRYAFGVGMIWGLFIGAAVGGFASLLALTQRIIKLRIDSTRK